jgi:hypothetical protein
MLFLLQLIVNALKKRGTDDTDDDEDGHPEHPAHWHLRKAQLYVLGHPGAQRQTAGCGTYDRNVSAEIVGGQYDGNIHLVREGAVSFAHQKNHGSYFRNKAYQGKHQDRVTGD